MSSAPPTTNTQPHIEFHPDAPRPNFVWSMQLPLAWRLIDTHPARWQVGVDRLSEDYLPGVRLTSAQKKLVKRQLEELVGQSQKAGALLTLVLPGLVDDDLSAATVVLRWTDSAPSPASILSAERQLADLGPVVEHTGRGDSYVFASRTAQVGPVTKRRTAYTHQAVLPVAGTTMTLMVSGTAPSADTSDSVADIVRRLVSGVRAYPDTSGVRLHDEESHTAADTTGDSLTVTLDSNGVVM